MKVILISFIFIMTLSACTEGVPEFSDLISNVSIEAPKFSSETNKTVKVFSATDSLSVSGECDVRITELSVSTDDGATWSEGSQVFGSTSDMDCSDGTFSIDVSDVSTLVSLSALGDKQEVKLRGKSSIGETDVSTLEVFWSEPNVAPVITSSCSTNATQDASYSCTAAVTDSNTLDTHTWSLNSTNTCIWASINNSGVISGTPNDNQVGDCTLSFVANDGTEDSNLETYTITVTNVQPTLAISDATSIQEDSAAAVIRADADIQASDEGFGVYTFDHTGTTSPKCEDNKISLTIDPATGAVTYQPAANYNGTCHIKVVFDDENSTSNTDSDEFSITVNAVNDAPVISSSCSSAVVEDTAYACSPVYSDSEGDTATWSFATGHTCTWMSINASSGVLSGTPNDDQVGPCDLKYKANDGTSDSNVLSHAVNVSNVQPTLSIANATAILEDSAATIVRADASVQASDEGFGVYTFDHATTTSPKCNDNKSSLAINSSTGAVTYQPAANYSGTCNIKVKFDDQNSLNNTVIDEFSVTVTGGNDAPVVSSSCSTTVNEDDGYSCTATVSDPDSSDTHTWSMDTTNNCAWASINSSGVISGTPNDNQVGSCTLAFKANDGTVNSNVQSHTVTVTNVQPTLSIANAATISEDASSAVIRTDAAVQASDESFGVYTFDHVGTTTPKCNDNALVLSIDSTTGAVTYQPAANYSGTCNIKVTFDDQNSPNNTASDEFTVTVSGTNDAPVITSSCSTTVNEDDSYSCTATVSDLDSGDTHTWSMDTTNGCTWASINSSGVISGTPNDDHVGSCTLAFKANDGTVDSNIKSYILTISNVQPTLTIANVAGIAEDSPAAIVRADGTVQASDEGFGVYTFDHAGTTTPKCDDNKLNLTIDPSTGAITYQPSANYTGTCNVKVVFDDQNAPNNLVSDEFSITVSDVNDPPVLTKCSDFTAGENSAASCASSAIDPEGGSLAWSLAGDCSWAGINPSTGEITGTPLNPDVGTCVATVTVTDNGGLTDDANINITVSNVASPFDLSGHYPVVGEAAGDAEILSGSLVEAQDESEGNFTGYSSANSTSSPDCRSHGTVSVHATTGAVNFDPEDSFTGRCYIGLEFDDSTDTSLAEFPVYVNPKPEIQAARCYVAAYEGESYSCDLSEFTTGHTDVAPGGSLVDALTWSKVTSSFNDCGWINSSHINSSTGQLAVTPSSADAGTCQLHFQVNDGYNTSNVWKIHIEVEKTSGVGGLAIGAKSSCALRDDHLYCWGLNDEQILGNSLTETAGETPAYGDLSAPRRSVLKNDGVTALRSHKVSLAEKSACSRDELGAVWCWGDRVDGQSGVGVSVGTSGEASQVLGGEVGGSFLAGVADIVSGRRHHCATLSSDGRVACWGRGRNFTLGNGLTSDQSSPVYVKTDSGTELINVIQVASGEDFNCALMADRRLKCWGENQYGQLGLESETDQQYANNFVIGADVGDIASVKAGLDHVCAIGFDGQMKCWGDGWGHVLGYGNTNDIGDGSGEMSGLGFVSLAGGTRVKDFALGEHHSCVLTETDTVRCWGGSQGSDAKGALGNNSTSHISNASAANDIPLTTSGAKIISVKAGELHTCVLLDSGVIKCFGDDSSYALGNGNDFTADYGKNNSSLKVEDTPSVYWRAGCSNSYDFQENHTNGSEGMTKCGGTQMTQTQATAGLCRAGSRLCSMAEYHSNKDSNTINNSWVSSAGFTSGWSYRNPFEADGNWQNSPTGRVPMVVSYLGGGSGFLCTEETNVTGVQHEYCGSAETNSSGVSAGYCCLD